MKKYSIRLYRLHDMDLLSLIGTTEFNFIKAAYCILKAYANNEVFVVDIPRDRDVVIPKYERRYQKNLYLDEEKDADVIALLESFAKGYRCNFIKNLMRLYIAFPMSIEFLDDRSQIVEFQKRNNIFRTNRKIADAASLKKNPLLADSFIEQKTQEESSKLQTDTTKTKIEKPKNENTTKKRNDFVFEKKSDDGANETSEELLPEDESEDLLKALMSMK